MLAPIVARVARAGVGAPITTPLAVHGPRPPTPATRPRTAIGSSRASNRSSPHGPSGGPSLPDRLRISVSIDFDANADQTGGDDLVAPDLNPDDVSSRADLVEYLAALARDVQHGRTARNATAAELIEAAGGWTADMDGYFAGRGESVPADPSWRLIAQIVTAALVYE